MLKVKVRFTGKKDDIEEIITYLMDLINDNYPCNVFNLSEVSGFYPNRGCTTEGHVYFHLFYDEEI